MTSIEQLRLAWHSIMSGDGGGYGYVSSKMYDALHFAGASMVSHTSFNWDLAVAVSPPRSMLIGRSETRPDLVFHTMFECEPLPPEWPNILNRCGLIWVPSDYCHDLFREYGVTTPIFKVGYAVESELYRPAYRVERDEPFKVLVWADSLISRKNPLRAIKAFVQAALPNSVLEVKVSDGIAPSGNWMIDGKKIENIVVHSDYWRRQDVVKWLQGGDVGIYLSGGEGYGLMPKEAMATGLPMITTNNTGMKEYIDPSYALIVESPEKELSQSFVAHFGMDLYTYKPNFDQVVDYLRYAYNNRKELYEMGMRAIPNVTRQTWEDVGTEALYHLQAYHDEIKNH